MTCNANNTIILLKVIKIFNKHYIVIFRFNILNKQNRYFLPYQNCWIYIMLILEYFLHSSDINLSNIHLMIQPSLQVTLCLFQLLGNRIRFCHLYQSRLTLMQVHWYTSFQLNTQRRQRGCDLFVLVKPLNHFWGLKYIILFISTFSTMKSLNNTVLNICKWKSIVW